MTLQSKSKGNQTFETRWHKLVPLQLTAVCPSGLRGLNAGAVDEHRGNVFARVLTHRLWTAANLVLPHLFKFKDVPSDNASVSSFSDVQHKWTWMSSASSIELGRWGGGREGGRGRAYKTFLLNMLRRIGQLQKNPTRHQVPRGLSIESRACNDQHVRINYGHSKYVP